jgi:soluble lytic murein transglycosylase-like protein
MRLRLDRLTLAVLVAGIVMLNALLFIAGAIVGAIPRAQSAETPRPRVVQAAPEPQPAFENVTARVSYTPPPALQAPVRLNVRYEPLIRSAAERHNLSPVLIAAVARVESDFDPMSLSHKNARGVMQVIPETGARFGVGPKELFDPERNIHAGTAYLSWLLDRYRGDVDLALAAYNAGEGAVDRYRGIPPYRETRDYVRKVRKAYDALHQRQLRN